MPRIAFVLTLAALLLAAGPWAPADAAKRKRTACERLAGEDLAPARKLKVVRRESRGAVTVRACTLRGGRVRTLASFTPEGEFESGDIEVEATTDRHVLLAETHAERGSGAGLARVDARTRRRVSIASSSCDPMQFCTGTRAEEAVMHRSGAVVAIVRGFPPCCSAPASSVAAQVVLVGVDGTRRVLDEAQELTTLAIEGDDVVWSRAGQPQRAPVG